MKPATLSRVRHLELHTGDVSSACAFYGEVCGWRPECVPAGEGEYLALDLGPALTGGMVESGTQRALWLPYVEVPDIDAATEQARRLGARVLLEPREGPAGWRSVVATAAGGEIAFWEVKRLTCGPGPR
jgi:hypothetical protein